MDWRRVAVIGLAWVGLFSALSVVLPPSESVTTHRQHPATIRAPQTWDRCPRLEGFPCGGDPTSPTSIK